ncbi:hypothetical protein L1887_21073 [Cichorium endivia]|nr:hypothetical protein L1887_21073 [Cichorium endivia]
MHVCQKYRHSWTGYQIRIKISNSYYMFNHLKFIVSVQKYEEMNVPGYIVVGFEVNPCSVKHNPETLKNLKTYGKYPFKISCDDNTVNMEIKENKPIAFTYEVTFIESDIKWPSRWNVYMKIEGAKVWFSIVNSLIVVTFMAEIILVIFLKRVKRDLTHHEDTQSQMNEEYSNSKLVVPDILRAPIQLFLCNGRKRSSDYWNDGCLHRVFRPRVYVSGVPQRFSHRNANLLHLPRNFSRIHRRTYVAHHLFRRPQQLDLNFLESCLLFLGYRVLHPFPSKFPLTLNTQLHPIKSLVKSLPKSTHLGFQFSSPEVSHLVPFSWRLTASCLASLWVPCTTI